MNEKEKYINSLNVAITSLTRLINEAEFRGDFDTKETYQNSILEIQKLINEAQGVL